MFRKLYLIWTVLDILNCKNDTGLLSSISFYTSVKNIPRIYCIMQKKIDFRSISSSVIHIYNHIFCTCSIWAVKLHWPGYMFVIYLHWTRYIFFWYICVPDSREDTIQNDENERRFININYTKHIPLLLDILVPNSINRLVFSAEYAQN